jgi:glycosyltransferase involved in cell wall biosynthesis
MKLISICLPTYNRSSLVINQLEFLKKETLEYSDLIDIYVSDNNSDKKHQIRIKEYHKANPFFKLKQQSKNHGLIGNIYQLLDRVDTEYVWFVGDDDVLLPKIIKRIVNILSKKLELSFVFLNHHGFINDLDNIVTTRDLLNYSGKVTNGKQCVIEIFKKNFTALMFISACIYKTEVLKTNFVETKRKIRIVDPLLFSFVCASKGSIFIEEEIFVLDRYANATWENITSKIFGWEVPLALIELDHFQFNYKTIRELLVAYYKKFDLSYLKMLFFSPFKVKLKIFFFLRFFNFILLMISFKFVTSSLLMKVAKFFRSK